MSKQDRQGARTVAELGLRLNYDERFSEVMGVANDARSTANQALSSTTNPAEHLSQEEVFNLLTNNGINEGIFRGEDGEIYINASYLKTGKIVSADGLSSFDLETGTITSKAGNSMPYVEIKSGDIFFYNHNGKVVARMMNPLFGLQIIFYNADTEAVVGTLESGTNRIEIGTSGGNFRFDDRDGITATCYDEDTGAFETHTAHWKTVNGVKTLVAF